MKSSNLWRYMVWQVFQKNVLIMLEHFETYVNEAMFFSRQREESQWENPPRIINMCFLAYRHHLIRLPKGAAWAAGLCSPRLWWWQDAASPPPAHSSSQVSCSHLPCKLFDYRDKPAKPWINPWGSPVAAAVTMCSACFRWLCTYGQLQLHHLMWLEKAPKEWLHAQKHMTEFGDECEWCQMMVTGYDRIPKYWYVRRRMWLTPCGLSQAAPLQTHTSAQCSLLY